ncbi:MAG: hypothetical protein QW057_05125 [Candidatus Bathyarchaeia archaeon]
MEANVRDDEAHGRAEALVEFREGCPEFDMVREALRWLAESVNAM